MKKFFFVVSFLILFVTNALAITVGEVKDKMGSTFNERGGKTEKVIAGYLLEMNDFDGKKVLFLKQMTKHLVDIEHDFLPKFKNIWIKVRLIFVIKTVLMTAGEVQD